MDRRFPGTIADPSLQPDAWFTMQAEAGGCLPALPETPNLPHSTVLLDEEQSLLGAVHLGGPRTDHFDDLNWYDANINAGTVLGNHSFDGTFQNPTLHGLHSNGQSGHDAPSFDVSDFEDPFTETGLDLQEHRAFGLAQHEPPSFSDTHGLGRGYFIMPATMSSTAVTMGFNTTEFPLWSTVLDQQNSNTDTIGNGNDNAPRFPCSFRGCAKSFKRSTDRDRHSRIHQPDAPSYHCAALGCKYSEGKGFYRHDKLLSHERNVHKMHKD
ncbi:hypothetical protein MMC17_005791 [Xylographa soralifera]|nr:hypothetical protein [Xylographa soralifera]